MEDMTDWLIRRENSIGQEETADEMFEKLGYKKDFDNSTEIVYSSDQTFLGDRCIHKFLFAKVSKIVFSYGEELSQSVGFGMQELQAINKKVQELGWIK